MRLKKANKSPKLPNKIKVGSRTYRITREVDHGYKGYHKHDEQLINISPHAASLEDERETVLHEVNHAIYQHFFYHLNGEMGPGEEACVECMSKGIMMVMQDNPKLKEYLFG